MLLTTTEEVLLLPLIDNNVAPFGMDTTVAAIAVSGFRAGCGKSVLAHATALSFVRAGYSTCLVKAPNKGVQSSAFTQFMRIELGKSETTSYTVLTEDDDRSTYDRVVYDGLPQIAPTLLRCVYITPDFAEDDNLGITSDEAVRFRGAVQSKIAERWPDIQTEFVPLGRAAMNPQSEMLAKTDWMVIRSLETQFLQGTKIAELRNYIRLAELSGWEPGTRI